MLIPDKIGRFVCKTGPLVDKIPQWSNEAWKLE